MAAGDLIQQGRGWLHLRLLQSVTGTSNGLWVDTGNYNQVSIHVDGITTGTVKIHGSCATSKPSATDHDSELASTGTNDTMVTIEPLPRWLKARVSTAGGTIKANAVFRSKP